MKELKLTEKEKESFYQECFTKEYHAVRERFLNETIKPNFKCVEIGVFRGEFSDIILTYNPAELILVDSWICSELSGDTIYALEMGKESQEYFSSCENEVREKFKHNKKVKIIKNYSIIAAKEFEDNSLDWVYIDAAHHYKAVLNDLNAWMPKIKIGGYLCGDDFLINTVHSYGVIEAVHEFLNLDKFTTELNIKHKKYGNLQYKVIGCQFYIHRIN